MFLFCVDHLLLIDRILLLEMLTSSTVFEQDSKALPTCGLERVLSSRCHCYYLILITMLTFIPQFSVFQEPLWHICISTLSLSSLFSSTIYDNIKVHIHNVDPMVLYVLKCSPYFCLYKLEKKSCNSFCVLDLLEGGGWR